MATRNPSFKQELEEYHDSLDRCLRCRFGMTLKVYKLVKMVTQLLGVAGGIYAMQQGAQPLAIFFMMTVIIAGPESLEYLIEQGDAP